MMLKKVFLAAALVAAALSATAQQVLPDRNDLFIVPKGKQGCWASFFAGEDFRAPAVRFTGRTYIESFEPQAVAEPALQGVGGAPFLKHVESLVVGPHARIVGYSGQWFDNPSLELEPGQQIGDLAAIGFHDHVQSFKVLCVPDEE